MRENICDCYSNNSNKVIIHTLLAIDLLDDSFASETHIWAVYMYIIRFKRLHVDIHVDGNYENFYLHSLSPLRINPWEEERER